MSCLEPVFFITAECRGSTAIPPPSHAPVTRAEGADGSSGTGGLKVTSLAARQRILTNLNLELLFAGGSMQEACRSAGFSSLNAKVKRIPQVSDSSESQSPCFIPKVGI